VTIIQRTPLGAPGGVATPRARSVTPAAAPSAVRPPNDQAPGTVNARWKPGRVRIAAAIAVVLIILLILTQL
jgi:hypothetical protein